MTTTVTLTLPTAEIERVQSMLDGAAAAAMTVGEAEAQSHYTLPVPSSAGLQIDLKIVTTDDGAGYVDAVLFKDGSEAQCLEPAEDFAGEYRFEFDGNEIVALVVPGEPLLNTASLKNASALCRACWAEKGEDHEASCIPSDEVNAPCERCGVAHFGGLYGFTNGPDGCDGSGGHK